MDTTWLITVVGNDDPELLQQFTAAIALCEGSLLDHQLVSMAGRLSGLYRIRLPQEHVAWAWKRLEGFAAAGLYLVAREQLSSMPHRGPNLSVEISGPYRLGLDQDIRIILESHGADIEHYNQQAVAAATNDRVNFQAHIQARLTRDLCGDRLQQTLLRLNQDLSVDLSGPV